MMVSRRLLIHGAMLALWAAACFAQERPKPSAHPALHQFPLTLQQSLESGKATIGTKVQGKLVIATMFQGIVIPRNAVFSGVVVESNAKSEKAPAKLAIRMDTAEWKDRSVSMSAYLMPLYYAPAVPGVQNLPNESPDPSSRSMDGEQSQSPMQRSYPTNDSQAAQAAIPESPSMSNRPVKMKNVEIVRADEGGAALASEGANIKVYKMTTYVFAATEPTID